MARSGPKMRSLRGGGADPPGAWAANGVGARRATRGRVSVKPTASLVSKNLACERIAYPLNPFTNRIKLRTDIGQPKLSFFPTMIPPGYGETMLVVPPLNKRVSHITAHNQSAHYAPPTSLRFVIEHDHYSSDTRTRQLCVRANITCHSDQPSIFSVARNFLHSRTMLPEPVQIKRERTLDLHDEGHAQESEPTSDGTCDQPSIQHYYPSCPTRRSGGYGVTARPQWTP